MVVIIEDGNKKTLKALPDRSCSTIIFVTKPGDYTAEGIETMLGTLQNKLRKNGAAVIAQTLDDACEVL